MYPNVIFLPNKRETLSLFEEIKKIGWQIKLPPSNLLKHFICSQSSKSILKFSLQEHLDVVILKYIKDVPRKGLIYEKK